MDAIEAALADVAESFSLPGLSLGDRGAAGLMIEDMGLFTIERLPGEGGVLLSLHRDLDSGRALRALEVCGPARRHPWPILAGTAPNGWIGFSARLAPAEFTAGECERFLTYAAGLLSATEGK